MTTAVLLVLLGALTRLLPHPPNFVALGALALYSGARLPRRVAVAVPLAAMALSDLALDATQNASSAGPCSQNTPFRNLIFNWGKNRCL